MTKAENELSGSNRPPGQLVIRTLAEVVSEVQLVELVAAPGQDVPGMPLEPWMAPGIDAARSRICDRVEAGLRTNQVAGSFTCVITGARWRALVEPIRLEGGDVMGALLVARPEPVWSKWERALLRTFAGVLSQEVVLLTRERSLLLQRRLDELLGEIAERLMSTSPHTRQEVLTWTVRMLTDFFAVDAAILRRHDAAAERGVIEAQWSLTEPSDWMRPTEPSPDPDPFGLGTRDLTKTLLLEVDLGHTPATTFRGSNHFDGAQRLGLVSIPLAGAVTPWGVLWLLHARHRAWAAEELRMLQAVGTLLMQLQARLDAEEQTMHNAVHDELTGLPNRRALLTELSGRLVDNRRTAILFFDLDRFKVMNDFLGHASGDKILSTVAGRIRSTIGPGDFAARLGGDEFVVLLSDVGNETVALEVADRILSELRKPIDFAGQQITHAASIGVVISKIGVHNGLELIGWADIALYAAKRRGGNQAVLFDEDLRTSVSQRSRTELTLRQALEGNGLLLHYQPEVDLRTGELLAVEALVRWEHPELGILPASAFMAIAEEAGLVVDMGRWVFTEACRQLGVWQREYPALAFAVRVNVSPSQFMIGDFAKVIENCLLSHRVPGDRLCIEIAERAILQEPEQTARIVRGVRALGIEVAIDDFGTNYASFAELKRLPVNYLKLCPDFVQGVDTDIVDRAIVETITRLASALNLGVIAKGIENGETVSKLLDLSCSRGQGSFISRPLATHDLTSILRAGGVMIRSNRRGTLTSAAPFPAA